MQSSDVVCNPTLLDAHACRNGSKTTRGSRTTGVSWVSMPDVALRTISNAVVALSLSALLRRASFEDEMVSSADTTNTAPPRVRLLADDTEWCIVRSVPIVDGDGDGDGDDDDAAAVAAEVATTGTGAGDGNGDGDFGNGVGAFASSFSCCATVIGETPASSEFAIPLSASGFTNSVSSISRADRWPSC